MSFAGWLLVISGLAGSTAHADAISFGNCARLPSALDSLAPEDVATELYRALRSFPGVAAVYLETETAETRLRIDVTTAKAERALGRLFPRDRRPGGLPVVVRIVTAAEVGSLGRLVDDDPPRAPCASALTRAVRTLRRWCTGTVDPR